MQVVFTETKGSIGFHAGIEQEKQLGLKAGGEERTHLRTPPELGPNPDL